MTATVHARLFALLLALATLAPGRALAEPEAAAEGPAIAAQDWIDWRTWLDNDYYKVHLSLRPRVEVADLDGLKTSQAWTVRTRLGVESKPWNGLSALVEMEGTFTFDQGEYWDVASPPNGRTPVADPEFIELNRGVLRYERPDVFGVKLAGGRQRIILDDARFIGNVGWRQNEQTYDAVRGSTSFGIDGLRLTYAYLWNVNRIFGDQGATATRDFDSDSHAIHLRFAGLEALEAVAFAYLLDLEESPVDSSHSYGLRLAGSRALGERWKIGLAGSYAYQTDAGRNAVDYGAHYGRVEGSVGHADWATAGVGYESLGSDDGKAGFRTPLATLHKFNGFADAFLDNGGPDGLQDLFATLSPELPWQLGGKVVYHHFWSERGGRDLGYEIDAVLSRPLAPGLTALTKFAYYDGTSNGRADRWRYWFQLTYTY